MCRGHVLDVRAVIIPQLYVVGIGPADDPTRKRTHDYGNNLTDYVLLCRRTTRTYHLTPQGTTWRTFTRVGVRQQRTTARHGDGQGGYHCRCTRRDSSAH